MRIFPVSPFAPLKTRLGVILLAVASWQSVAAAEFDGPKNGTILLIRHAEKLEGGDGLSTAGEERARAYVKYFEDLMIHSESAKPSELIATADSKHSHRPRLTLEPLGKALGLPVDSRFKNDDYQSMAASLHASRYDHKTTLICWHHGDMPELLHALGADAGTVLPGGKWPGDEYDWLIELRYDDKGHLESAERVEEHLTAGAH